MTNEGETEKNELMKAEHNYAMDMNRFASTSRLHVPFHNPLERQFEYTVAEHVLLVSNVTSTGSCSSRTQITEV